MLSFIKNKILAQNASKILVCYGKINPYETKDYELLILEESHFTAAEVKVFKKNNTKVVAYLSLAEINKHAKYYEYVKDYTLGENSIWNSFHLDLSSTELRNQLFKIIDEIMAKGFDGLFLDNIDNVGSFGPHPEFKEYLIGLIEEIKKRNKNIFLIQNSGLEMIKKTSNLIDMVAVESIITNYNFKTNTYALRDKSESAERIAQLDTLSDQYKLNILLIEYADRLSLYNKTKKLLIKSGYNYFIGNIELQTIPKF